MIIKKSFTIVMSKYTPKTVGLSKKGIVKETPSKVPRKGRRCYEKNQVLRKMVLDHYSGLSETEKEKNRKQARNRY